MMDKNQDENTVTLEKMSLHDIPCTSQSISPWDEAAVLFKSYIKKLYKDISYREQEPDRERILSELSTAFYHRGALVLMGFTTEFSERGISLQTIDRFSKDPQKGITPEHYKQLDPQEGIVQDSYLMDVLSNAKEGVNELWGKEGSPLEQSVIQATRCIKVRLDEFFNPINPTEALYSSLKITSLENGIMIPLAEVYDTVNETLIPGKGVVDQNPVDAKHLFFFQENEKQEFEKKVAKLLAKPEISW